MSDGSLTFREGTSVTLTVMTGERIVRPYRVAGNPVTHGQLVGYSRVDPHRACQLQLEFHGWREDGEEIEWEGAGAFREVFCPEHGGVSTVHLVEEDREAVPVPQQGTITEF